MERDPELEARIRQLELQVAALGQPPTVPDAAPEVPLRRSDPAPSVGGVPEPGPADVVEAAEPGIVQYAGEVELPAGGTVSWRWGLAATAVLAADWSPTAHALAALGHPVRLEILRAVLHGIDTVAALVEHLETGTSGQVYHHVRELASAGWLAPAKRGEYTVPPERIIPLLAIVLAAGTPG